ncbi:MAG: hypothetical protein NPIRA03_41480 [Nitrospirales bacterium]|nr:MAG: hypothetical protein NPIRA03_41480 [Nitrospirales bacterium]
MPHYFIDNNAEKAFLITEMYDPAKVNFIDPSGLERQGGGAWNTSLTMDKAIERYNNGVGGLVAMNLSSVDFSEVSPDQLSQNIGGHMLISASGSDYPVHGRFYVNVVNSNTIEAIPGLKNTFDWEPHSFTTHPNAYSPDSIGVLELATRNAATSLGEWWYGIEPSGYLLILHTLDVRE